MRQPISFGPIISETGAKGLTVVMEHKQMARILIASNPNSISVVEGILSLEHELKPVTTMADVVATSEQELISPISIDLHFDESRMIELTSECRAPKLVSVF
jgi:hypothetical protein